jgi:CubicO group peptidase (beta-lactamase class C family)
MAQVEGHVEAGFEAVRDAFVRNFEEHGDVGAACAVHVEGRKMVDLWGGTADVVTGAPYVEDTLQMVFSTTKGATAVCANLLIERGLLEVDRPVVDYWPEFAAEGKDQIPVRWLLCHKSGLPIVDADLTVEEVLAWDPIVEALAAQKPIWEPGTAHGYHALTYGWLVGEIVRRVSGRPIGQFFAEEVAAPLGLEFWIGLPAEHEHRVAPLVTLKRPADPKAAELFEQFFGPDTLTGRALNLSGTFAQEDVWNRAEVHAAEIPAANGITNARSLSRMYAALVGEVDGVRILSADTIERVREPQTEGSDKVLFFETKFGLGFMLSSPFSPYGGPAGFGHAGAGGSVGFADPDSGIGFGYVMNKMQQNLSGDPRTLTLIDAVYASL